MDTGGIGRDVQCYAECHVNCSETLVEEMKRVLEWGRDRDKIMGRNESCPAKER